MMVPEEQGSTDVQNTEEQQKHNQVEEHDDEEEEHNTLQTKPWDSGLEVVMAVRTLDAVEKDAHAVAQTLSSLLGSLQSALSKVTTSSVEHVELYNEVAGRVQEAALDAAMKGNRFVNACLRINEEMKGINGMAAQLKVLRQTVDHFERQINRVLPRAP